MLHVVHGATHLASMLQLATKIGSIHHGVAYSLQVEHEMHRAGSDSGGWDGVCVTKLHD